MKNPLIIKFLSGAIITAFCACTYAQNTWTGSDHFPFYTSNLSYYIENGTSDLPNENNIIQRAFHNWAEPSGLTFTQVYTSDTANITLKWGTFNEMDVYSAITNTSYNPNFLINGLPFKRAEIIFDSSEKWGDHADYQKYGRNDLFTVAAHEIGHALGFTNSESGHSSSTLSIMYYSIAYPQRYLGVEDYISLISYYGTNQEVLELPLSQSFEEGTYSWSNTGEYDWFPNKNGTPTSTTGAGSAADGTYYAYVESNGKYIFEGQSQRGCNIKGDTAILESPLFDSTYADFQFKYFLRGKHIGTLYADIYSNGSWKTLWSISGHQNNAKSAWHTTKLDLGSNHGVAKVRIRYVAKGGYKGDAAIDSISITRK